MTEDDRDAFNAKEYARFRGKGTTRNECEICGFVPYTKNKYREKQDHLAKLHFKVSLQIQKFCSGKMREKEGIESFLDGVQCKVGFVCWTTAVFLSLNTPLFLNRQFHLNWLSSPPDLDPGTVRLGTEDDVICMIIMKNGSAALSPF